MDIIGTLPNGVKAFVGSPTGSTTKTDPSVPSSPGNPSVPVTGMSSANTKIAPSAPTASPMNPLPVSTTTLSNANKINQIPGIVNTTNNLSKTGISTDINGNAQYANGTLVPTPDTAPAPNPNPAPNSATTTTGGYVGDVYYAPGATLPLDANGKPQQTTETSPADNQIMQSLNAQKAQTDATTASIIDNITAQYSQLIQQQQQANQGSQATTNNALLMGGVTGQGSSAQFAPISSVGIMQAQVSYGIQKIADLNNKEQTAILAAQQAGQQADFQLQDKINAQISKIRDDKVAAATKLNDQIAAQNQKLADEKLQASKDTAIAEQYQNGVTDPAEILKNLKAAGLSITAKEVGDTLGTISAGIDLQQKLNSPFSNVDSNTQQFLFGMIQKYPDAGIAPGDSIQQITDKIQKSAMYQSDLLKAQMANGQNLTLEQKYTIAEKLVADGSYSSLPEALNALENGAAATESTTSGGLSAGQQLSGTARTDRNNNPVAMTTDVAKSLGLVEGKDYINNGDTFKGGDGKTYTTATLLGSGVDTTIKGLDNAAQKGLGAFTTASGKPRWSYINMTDQQWNSLSQDQKVQVVNKMYQQEGGAHTGSNSATTQSDPFNIDTSTPEGQAKFLDTLPKPTADLIKQIDNYQVDPTKALSLRGNSRQRIMSLVSAYDPTYDQTQFGTRAALRKSVTSGTISQTINSANTVIGHLKELKDAFNSLNGAGPGQGNSNVPFGNRINNAIANAEGKAGLSGFETAKSAVTSELAKLYKGSGSASDSEIESFAKSLSSNMSPAQFSDAIKKAINLMSSKLDAIQTQYEQGMGKPTDFKILNDNSRKILNNEFGYNLDNY